MLIRQLKCGEYGFTDYFIFDEEVNKGEIRSEYAINDKRYH